MAHPPTGHDPLITLRLPFEASAPARSRASLEAVRDDIPSFDDAMLLVSEIVTNALEHAGPLEDGSIELAVRSIAGAVRVAIRSDWSHPPMIHAAGDQARIRGRGLSLVGSLATTWGYYNHESLVVWFEMGDRNTTDNSEPTDAIFHDRMWDARSVAALLDMAVCSGPWGWVEVEAPALSERPITACIRPFAGLSPGGREPTGSTVHRSTQPGVSLVAYGPRGADPHLLDELCRRLANAIVDQLPNQELPMEQVLDDLRYLAEASQVLASSLDYEETLRMVARLAVPARADWCTINLVDESGSIRRVAVEHANPAYRDQLEQLLDSHPHDPGANSGVPRVIRTGRSLLVPIVDDDLLVETANSPEYLEITRSLNIRSVIIVPLIADGAVLGAASFVSTDRGRIRYDDHALSIAEDLGRRAATAILNARKYSDRNRLVGALTATLLPDRLPVIPGFDLAVEYRSAIGDLDVGGDFYDVVPANGGWYVIVGDVQGKGIEAATLIGLARHTLRAAALRDADPGDALLTLNRALLASPIGRTCTAVCARFEAAGDGARARVVRAGHPPPIAVTDGEVQVIEPRGMLLGFMGEVPLSEQVVDLAPGDIVTFYTDGVLARFAEDEDSVAAAITSSTQPSEIASALAGPEGADLRDDIAVVVVGVSPPTP